MVPFHGEIKNHQTSEIFEKQSKYHINIYKGWCIVRHSFLVDVVSS